MSTVKTSFESIGGSFVASPDDIAAALSNCRGLVFDWDGVFNSGRKGISTESDFTEADSMGTNMLRYGLWRSAGKLPFTAIISGEDNKSAIRFARRECFDSVYTGIKDKRNVIEHLSGQNDLDSKELICVFDDINDLGMAKLCGVRLMVRRDASPLLKEYATQRSLCDYVTGSSEFAVREVCELLLGLSGAHDDVVQSRVAYDEEYRRYFQARQAVTTKAFVMRDNLIIEHDALLRVS
ncbi:MAG: phosphatase [Gammaproteobacteria bacterium]|nr:phosphatase [Gammaproteobacteria bacterium]